ncbi:MAG TPA: ECF-type sigma factor [Phycisphaerae bacterium]|nr:ECF-type sigma factor [Phycisphaerae bacterium]HRW55422.1 ECF-type sigma factor [Phycisphaerae bacterium]
MNAAMSPDEYPEATGGHGDITKLLSSASMGAPGAHDELLRAVHDQLRRLADSHMRMERPGHTLGATGLVNETFLRLFRSNEEQDAPPYRHRQAFYQAATTAMRRILIDHARARLAVKRAGGARRTERDRISVDLIEASETADPADLLALDEAMTQLASEDDRAAEVVRLRFYAGRNFEEIGQLLGVSDRTAKREWQFARARLQQLLDERGLSDPAE